MEARVFEHASAMPAPIWYFLHMNDATIEVAGNMAPARDIVVETDATLGDATAAFVEAMQAAQSAWDAAYGDKPVLANAVDEQAEELGGLRCPHIRRRPTRWNRPRVWPHPSSRAWARR